jgi:penicillin amidase
LRSRPCPDLAIALFLAGITLTGAITALSASPGHAHGGDQVRVAGLRAAATVTRDVDGIPHIKAANAHDLFFLQGWMHAEDRMFQMDVTRRRASGTLAELLGSSALASDVQLRRFGMRRTAEQTLPLLSRETQNELAAYADGVNAWLARNELPAQYASVQVTKIAPWSVVDSVLALKLLTFSLSFDLDIDRTTAVQAFDAAGLDGHATVFGDLAPFAPFNTASPVIDATRQPLDDGSPAAPATAGGADLPDVVTQMAADYLDQAEQVPLLAEALNRSGERGSNSWVIGGQHTANGRPILASDPHLGLDNPPVAYPIELEGGGFDTQGVGIPGSPYIILGQNRNISFGATQHFMDVTDTYVERIESDPTSPSGLSTVYQGQREPVVAIAETFRVNPRTAGRQDALDVVPAGGAIPAETLIVPRRNNGPLLAVDHTAGMALSVQVHRLLADHRSRGLPPDRPRPRRRRRPRGAAVLRRRRAAFRVCRPRGQYRLLHERRGARARGLAGRRGPREPASVRFRRVDRDHSQEDRLGPSPLLGPSRCGGLAARYGLMTMGRCRCPARGRSAWWSRLVAARQETTARRPDCAGS